MRRRGDKVPQRCSRLPDVDLLLREVAGESVLLRPDGDFHRWRAGKFSIFSFPLSTRTFVLFFFLALIGFSLVLPDVVSWLCVFLVDAVTSRFLLISCRCYLLAVRTTFSLPPSRAIFFARSSVCTDDLVGVRVAHMSILFVFFQCTFCYICEMKRRLSRSV